MPGLFACFSPSEDNVKSSVMLELKRSRDAAEAQTTILRKQLDQTLVAQQSAIQEAKEQREQTQHWQRLCEAKSHALVQVLHDCQGIVSNFETQLLSTFSTQAGITADSTCKVVTSPSGTSRSIRVSDGGYEQLVSDKPVEVIDVNLHEETEDGQPVAPEERVHAILRKLEKQHASAVDAHEKQTGDLVSAQKQIAKLDLQLATARQIREQAEAQAKNQLQAFQVERSALESGTSSLSELNAELSAQLEAAQKALTAAAAARAAAVESELHAQHEAVTAREQCTALQAEASEARKALETATKEMENLTDKVSFLQRAADAHKQQFDEASVLSKQQEQQIVDLKTQLATTQQLLKDSETAAAAAAAQVTELQASLESAASDRNNLQLHIAELQAALDASEALVKARSAALTNSEAKVAAGVKEVEALRSRLAQSESELCASQAAAAASATSLLTTKRELVTVRQQLAEVARNHGATLNSLGGTDEALAAATTHLQEVQEELTRTQDEVTKAIARATSAESSLASCQAQLSDVAQQLESASGQLASMQALVNSVALFGEAPLVAAGASGAGTLSTDERATFKQALVADAGLTLPLATAPLGMIACLASDEQVCNSLTDVRVEVDTGSVTSMEQVVLRAGCLASALSRCNALSRITLSSGGWGGNTEGAGLAGPFLGLAALLQARSALSASRPAAGMTVQQTPCVQIDTQLAGPSCGKVLVQLLSTGKLQLATAPGQPGLLLYSEHEHIDSWYREMLHTSTHPAVHRSITAAALSHKQLSSNSSAVGGGTVAGSVVGGSQYAASHYGGGAASSVWDYTPGRTTPSRIPHATAPASHASHHARGPSLGSMSVVSGMSGIPGRGGSGGGSGPAPVDCELLNMGLVSHHMVMVAVILVTCPHVKRLKLDGNKIGDAGAELLSLGLSHASGLRDLTLTRNAISKEGIRALAASLNACTSLKRLDLGEQRPGRSSGTGSHQHHHSSNSSQQLLPPAGAEVLATVLRAGGAPALQELGLGRLTLGEQGALALAGLLSSNHPLKRLVVSSQGTPNQSLVRLQAAATARPGFVLSLL